MNYKYEKITNGNNSDGVKEVLIYGRKIIHSTIDDSIIKSYVIKGEPMTDSEFVGAYNYMVDEGIIE
jgi:hypothetical protein